jgi:hypothetical protein
VVIAEEEEIADLGDDEVEVPAAGDEDVSEKSLKGDEGSDVSSIVNWAKGRKASSFQVRCAS